jgi:hypothetical protein
MRFGWVGALSLVVGFFGCATAESIAPDGTSGFAGAVATGGTGAGGKGDNPNDGGAGGVSGGSTGGVAGDTGGSGGDTGGTTSGGAAGSGGSSGSCSVGQKLCGGVCIPPSPGVGCSATDCTPCPSPPPNANSVCSGTLCDFSCMSGYTKSGSTCVSSGGGGGTGGTGGGGAGTGGTSGGSGCPAPCTPSDPTSQFLCAFYCAASGQSIGLCAPVLNCCTCS